MKYVQSITFRALCAVCMGCLLIAFPDNTTKWLVIIMGILFLIPGLISIFSYFRLLNVSDAMRPLFPIVGCGSLLFGLLLIILSSSFVDYMVYVLALFLILAGVSQIVNMMKIRSFSTVGKFFYIVPVLIILSGIFIFVRFEVSKTVIFYIIGISCIIYGLLELVAAIYFRKIRRQMVLAKKETEETPKENVVEPEIEKSESEEVPTPSSTENETTGEVIDFTEPDEKEE